jgi:hypothetical protein
LLKLRGATVWSNFDQLYGFRVLGEGACSSGPPGDKTVSFAVPSSSYNFTAETLIYPNYEETMSFLLDFTFISPTGMAKS